MSLFSGKYAFIVGSIAVLTGCSEVVPTTVSLPTITPAVTGSALPVISPPAEIVNTARPADPLPAAQTKPVYLDYSPELYARLKGEKPLVLFFYAAWCPTCRRMEQEITATLASFPPDTIILKTNYDTEVTLKRTWGIQVQSSVVVLNAQGESIFKGVDPGIDKMKAQISQSLL